MNSTITSAATRLRPSLTLAAARAALAAAQAEAARCGWRVGVAVVDEAGDLIAFERDDGAQRITCEVALGKARTAARLQAPSKLFEEFINAGKPSFLSTPGVTALEGGLPVSVQGQVVGAIGVSGAHGENDSQVAWAGVAALAAWGTDHA